MSTYEEEYASILSDTEEETITFSNILSYEVMKDEHEEGYVKDKEVYLGKIGRIVQGESNSNMITFSMDRYFDSVDLYGKEIVFLYQPPIKSIKKEVFVDYASNIEISDNKLKFRWVLSSGVTAESGKVKAAIQFIGTDEFGNPYSLKTTSFSFEVDESLNATDMKVTVTNDWFTEIESRLKTLETGGVVVTTNTNYEELNNIPLLAGKKIMGSKSLEDYGIAALSHEHSNYTTSTKVNELIDAKLKNSTFVKEDDFGTSVDDYLASEEEALSLRIDELINNRT